MAGQSAGMSRGEVRSTLSSLEVGANKNQNGPTKPSGVTGSGKGGMKKMGKC